MARPTPPKLCSVIPPTLHAAIPVDAVTATASDLLRYFSFSSAMMLRSSTDLPVPADPVKKTFLPCFTTASSTRCCSVERNTRLMRRFSTPSGWATLGRVSPPDTPRTPGRPASGRTSASSEEPDEVRVPAPLSPRFFSAKAADLINGPQLLSSLRRFSSTGGCTFDTSASGVGGEPVKSTTGAEADLHVSSELLVLLSDQVRLSMRNPDCGSALMTMPRSVSGNPQNATPETNTRRVSRAWSGTCPIGARSGRERRAPWCAAGTDPAAGAARRVCITR